jgi:hypothetical protein
MKLRTSTTPCACCAAIAALLKKAQAGQKKARVSKSALRIEGRTKN